MKIILLLLFAAPLGAQTWFTVPAQSSVNVSVTMPPGTTYQFCTTTKVCSTAITTTAVTSVVNYADGLNGRPADPAPGLNKILQVQELPTAYNVTVNDSTSKPTKITIIPVPVSTATVVGSYPATCVVYSDQSFICTATGLAVKL